MFLAIIGDIIMTEMHKKNLIDNKELMIENILPYNMEEYTQRQNIFTKADWARIYGNKSNDLKVQVKCMLELLQRKPDRVYEDFLLALRKTDHHHVANMLEKEGG